MCCDMLGKFVRVMREVVLLMRYSRDMAPNDTLAVFMFTLSLQTLLG